MTMSEGAGTRSDAQQQIIDRAEADPGFRSRLLENPKAAVQEQFGITVPADISVRIIEEKPGEAILVLPAKRTGVGTELSDADLDRVAGGTDSPYGW